MIGAQYFHAIRHDNGSGHSSVLMKGGRHGRVPVLEGEEERRWGTLHPARGGQEGIKEPFTQEGSSLDWGIKGTKRGSLRVEQRMKDLEGELPFLSSQGSPLSFRALRKRNLEKKKERTSREEWRHNGIEQVP